VAAPGESPSSDPAPWLPDDASAAALESYWRGAEPGWYVDPVRTDVLRYWDGKLWSQVFSPRSFSGGIPPPLPRGAPNLWERLRTEVVDRLRRL